MKKTKRARIQLRKESLRVLQADAGSSVAGGIISKGWFDCTDCTANSLVVQTSGSVPPPCGSNAC